MNIFLGVGHLQPIFEGELEVVQEENDGEEDYCLDYEDNKRVPDFVVVVNLDSVAGCLFFEIVVVGLTKHLLAHNAGS